jgi:hypothetical protein
MAEKNREGFGGNQHTGSLAKLPTNQTKIDTRKEAAKEAGIGERTLDAVKLIKDAGGEGAVVRNPRALYVAGRTGSVLRWVPQDPALNRRRVA